MAYKFTVICIAIFVSITVEAKFFEKHVFLMDKNAAIIMSFLVAKDWHASNYPKKDS